jgi:hypothetical protein
MEAAPDFGAITGGAVPTAAMPAQAAVAASAAGSPVAQRIPAPPPGGRAASGGGGGKGLIYGLGGVAVLLLGGLAYALMQNGDDPEIDPLVPTDTPTLAETAPQPTTEPESDDGDEGSAGAAAGGSGGDPIAPIGGGQTPRPPSNNTPRPPVTSTPTPPRPSEPPVESADACKECASMAQGGNITGAAAKFQQCSDTAKKNACSARAKRRAPAAAKAARTRQNCPKAKQIQAAANSMSAGSSALDSEVARCD